MIEIQEMVIRVPGLEEGQARQLGQDVAEHIAVGLPSITENQNIDSLNVTVSIEEGLSNNKMAELIAEQLLGQIK